jgi:hypothetical protein
MMDRRVFLKLTGLVAAASALDALPVAAASSPHAPSADRAHDLASPSAPPAARLTIREPGTYRISGLVRLQEPLVEISGITNSQMISWSRVEGSKPPVASFMSFERFDAPGMTPDIQVRGGHLEALAVVPMDLE